MKSNLQSIDTKKLNAVFGKEPVFKRKLPVGQMHIPHPDRIRESFSKIFANKYYNNNGPLHEELESTLSEKLNVKHAICVHNATLALMITSDCIKPSSVVIPSFTFAATLQSQLWCGFPVKLSDISLEDAAMPVSEMLYSQASASTLVMPVNLWSGCSKIEDYDELHASTGTNVVYDSAPAFGIEYNGEKLGSRGLAEIFSFHATKIINASEGGLITTNNDDLALAIRAKRPTYPSVSFKSDRVANCRFSEAQAALALLSLADFEMNVARNKAQYDRYLELLQGIEGLSVWRPANCSRSNYSSLVVIVDEATFGASRDTIISHLKAENVLARRYYFPGMHQITAHQAVSRLSVSMENTEILSHKAMQLPLGGLVFSEDIELIAGILAKLKNFYS